MRVSNHFRATFPALFVALVIALAQGTGCGNAIDLDGAFADQPTAVARSIVTGETADAVVALVNDPITTFEVLDDDVGLDRRAAANIVDARDLKPFDSIAELDAISYVGESALLRLRDYALQAGYGAEQPEVTDTLSDDATLLAFVNDEATSFELLDDDVGLDRRAARGIVNARPFATVAAVDAVPYVSARVLGILLEWANANGYGIRAAGVDAVFSPQLYPLSHNTRVAGLIDGAETSIDIAIYSFSDESIFDALERATDRGVAVRFIFETANADRKKEGAALESSRSARLERFGINVRYVNKIMHHKFLIVDGPRDDVTAAATARVASGSGNWSYGAATRYDENTLFLTGERALTLSLQREFDHMWSHSRDFVYDATLPYELSTAEIGLDDLATYQPSSDVAALFTSDNFTANGEMFRIRAGVDTIAPALVDAINRAEKSIRIASGHLRSRPVAEALMAKVKNNPEVAIRILLDGQEYISAYYNDVQHSNLTTCLIDAADSVSRNRRCMDRGFKYGLEVARAGMDVRFKFYSYRWHYSYAVQMHHKLMIIDDTEVWTGSYNLSDNAEHNTFENMFMVRGERYASVVASYVENFEALWELNRADGTYDALLDEVAIAPVIPLVFTPMALNWDEVTDLKAAIKENCGDINTEAFRKHPESHRICQR